LRLNWRVPLDTRQVAQLKRFGANLRRERDQRKLTQERLAERVGVHSRALQKIEAGDVDTSLTTLLQIQKALKCPWEDLLGRP
jgi:transcriptional regulator with XRE-family HTH domain